MPTQGQGFFFKNAAGKTVFAGAGNGQGQQSSLFAPPTTPIPAEALGEPAAAKVPHKAFVQPGPEQPAPAAGDGGTLSPEADYQQNGTKAKAFKSWFGDWEHDPANASKVVNAKGEPQETQPISGTASKVVKEGKPVAVYHGTAKGGFDAFDPKKTKKPGELLYAPGFYFTEDQSVAAEYMSGGNTKAYRALTVPPENRQAMVDEYTKEMESRGLPLKEPDTDWSWEKTRDNFLTHGRVSYLAGMTINTERMKVGVALGAKHWSGGEVKAAYLNIRKPFDMTRNRLSAEERGRIADALDRIKPWPASGHYQDIASAIRTDNIHPELIFKALRAPEGDYTKDRVFANSVLREAGYDGITHTGGHIMGGGHEHRVWIAFEPTQIKSTQNSGHFDPSNPDIRMSRQGGPGRFITEVRDGSAYRVFRMARDPEGSGAGGFFFKKNGKTIHAGGTSGGQGKGEPAPLAAGPAALGLNPRQRTGLVRPVEQEAQSARGLGKLTLDTDEAGKIDPNLVEAYRRHLATTGHSLGEFTVNPRTRLATAAVTHGNGGPGAGGTPGPDAKTPFKAFVQPAAQPAATPAAPSTPAATPPKESWDQRVARMNAEADQRVEQRRQQQQQEPTGGGGARGPRGSDKGGIFRKLPDGRTIFIPGHRVRGGGKPVSPVTASTPASSGPPPEAPLVEAAKAAKAERKTKLESMADAAIAHAQAHPNVEDPSGVAAAVAAQAAAHGEDVQHTPVAAPEPMKAAAEPKAPTPAPAARPAEAKPETQAGKGDKAPTKAALERHMLDAWERDTGASQAEFEDEKALQDFHAPFTFHGKLPGEVKDFLQGRAHLKRLFTTTQDASKAQGADAMEKLGQDRYFALAERGRASRVGQAVEHARNSQDPELKLAASIYDTMPERGERGKVENVHPDKLKLDDAGTINGLPVKVTIDADGNKILADGGDLPETPIDALTKPLPFDKGSLHHQEPELPAEKAAEHPVHAITRELDSIETAKAALKKRAMSYQPDLKAEVERAHGVAAGTYDLPYNEWASVRDKYLGEKKTAALAPHEKTPAGSPERIEALKQRTAATREAGKESVGVTTARNQLKRAETSGDPTKVTAARAKLAALQKGGTIGEALSAASEAANPARTPANPTSPPVPSGTNAAEQPDETLEGRKRHEHAAALRRAVAKMGERTGPKPPTRGEVFAAGSKSKAREMQATRSMEQRQQRTRELLRQNPGMPYRQAWERSLTMSRDAGGGHFITKPNGKRVFIGGESGGKSGGSAATIPTDAIGQDAPTQTPQKAFVEPPAAGATAGKQKNFTALPESVQADIVDNLHDRFFSETDVSHELLGDIVRDMDTPLRVHHQPVSELARQLDASGRQTSPAAVEKLSQKVSSGTKLDPVIVNGEAFVDGGHRVRAYQKSGETHIPAVDIAPLVSADWEKEFQEEIPDLKKHVTMSRTAPGQGFFFRNAQGKTVFASAHSQSGLFGGQPAIPAAAIADAPKSSAADHPFMQAPLAEVIAQKKKDAESRLAPPGEHPEITRGYAWTDRQQRSVEREHGKGGYYKIDMPVDLLAPGNSIMPHRMERQTKLGGSKDPGFVTIDSDMGTGEPVYTVDDGNHRVEHAKQSGKKTVPMYVTPTKPGQLKRLAEQIQSRSMVESLPLLRGTEDIGRAMDRRAAVLPKMEAWVTSLENSNHPKAKVLRGQLEMLKRSREARHWLQPAGQDSPAYDPHGIGAAMREDRARYGIPFSRDGGQGYFFTNREGKRVFASGQKQGGLFDAPEAAIPIEAVKPAVPAATTRRGRGSPLMGLGYNSGPAYEANLKKTAEELGKRLGAKTPAPASQSLPDFAAHVQRLGDEHPVGLGDNKVYLSHVAAKSGMEPEAFKAKVKEAAHAGLLKVSRADLPLDPAEEAKSEVNLDPGAAGHAAGGNATAHYLQVKSRGRTQIKGVSRPAAATKPDDSRAGRVRQGIAAVHEHTLSEYRERQAAPTGYAAAPASVKASIDAAHAKAVNEARAGGETIHPEVARDYPEKAKPPVDNARQLGLHGQGEIGERPGQASMFGEQKAVAPVAAEPKVKPQFDPKHTAEMFPAKASEPAKPTGRVEDAADLGPHNLQHAFEHYKQEIANSDPKLSPNRAGELAAARIRTAVHARLNDIHVKSRNGEITPKEEAFYDKIHVEGWSYGRELEKASGSRTLIGDEDHPLAQRPLNAEPLPNKVAEYAAESERNRVAAAAVDHSRAQAAAARKQKGEAFQEKERATRDEQNRRQAVAQWFVKEKGAPWRGSTPEQIASGNREFVKKRLSEGGHVPEHVLHDYPDLKPKTQMSRTQGQGYFFTNAHGQRVFAAGGQGQQGGLFGGGAAVPVEAVKAAEPKAAPVAAPVRPAVAVPRGETPVPTPKAARKLPPTGDIQDFGEKIGGARKDTATPLGPRGPKPIGPADERPGWHKRWVAMQQVKGMDKTGKWTVQRFSDDKRRMAIASMYSRGQTYDTREAAEAAIPLHEVSRNHRVTNAARQGEPANYAIVRDITDRKRAVVKGGFPTEQAAKEHMAAHPVEIIEHKFPFPDEVEHLTHIQREGPTHRTGDVKPEDFQKAFGFRGGEFGNWNMGHEGQEALNHAYDSLHDLAHATGLHPKALSIGGELGIAFGARGTGGKGAGVAHYEPDKTVINLTKIKGAGSLAHEWYHALDNHLGKMAGGKSEDFASAGLPYKHTMRPELASAVKNLTDTMMTKNVVKPIEATFENKMAERSKNAVAERIGEIERRMGDEARYNKRFKPFTPEQQAEWNTHKAKLIAGDVGEKKIIGGDKPIRSGRNPFSFRQTFEPMERMNQLYKGATGRAFHTADQASQGHGLYWAVSNQADAGKRVAAAQQGMTETKKSRTDFYDQARQIDNYHTGDYYSEPHEMAARAFANYVHGKLEGQGRRSDYIASRGRSVNTPRNSELGKPYPEGEERTAIHGAFDNLFKTLKVEEGTNARGKPAHLVMSRAPRFARDPATGRLRFVTAA